METHFCHQLLKKTLNSTLSYALHILSFIVMYPSPPTFFFFIWCKVSKATKILSKIALSNWKALWDSEIKLGKILYNLLANTVEVNLYKILHKAMGKNFVTLFGLFIISKNIIIQLVGTSWCVYNIHESNPPSSFVTFKLSNNKKSIVTLILVAIQQFTVSH